MPQVPLGKSRQSEGRPRARHARRYATRRRQRPRGGAGKSRRQHFDRGDPLHEQGLRDAAREERRQAARGRDRGLRDLGENGRARPARRHGEGREKIQQGGREELVGIPGAEGADGTAAEEFRVGAWRCGSVSPRCVGGQKDEARRRRRSCDAAAPDLF